MGSITSLGDSNSTEIEILENCIIISQCTSMDHNIIEIPVLEWNNIKQFIDKELDKTYG